MRLTNTHTFRPNSDGYAAVFEEDMCLRISLDRDVKLNVISITRIGKEIATILPPVDPTSVFERLANALFGEVKSMDICRILDNQGDYFRLSAPISVLKSAAVDSS